MTWSLRRQAKPEDDSRLGTIVRVPSFQIGVTVIVILLVILAALLFWKGDQNVRETLNFIVLAGALGGGVISARHVWIGLKTSIEQRKQALQEQKVALALGFLSRWNDPNMAPLRRDFRRIKGQLDQSKNDVALIKDNIEIRTVVADMLNFFEEMGYAAKSGAADLETLKPFSGISVDYYRTTQAWINHRRKESKQAWKEFEWLCDQWKNDAS